MLRRCAPRNDTKGAWDCPVAALLAMTPRGYAIASSSRPWQDSSQLQCPPCHWERVWARPSAFLVIASEAKQSRGLRRAAPLGLGTGLLRRCAPRNDTKGAWDCFVVPPLAGLLAMTMHPPSLGARMGTSFRLPCHCERSEAISRSHERWPPSGFGRDCFVTALLAMTPRGHGIASSSRRWQDSSQ